MDAAGSRSATLVAVQDSVFIALAIAATAPKRVGSLVLFGGAASWLQNEDMPWAPSAEWWAEQIADDSDVESAFEQADGYARRNHEASYITGAELGSTAEAW